MREWNGLTILIAEAEDVNQLKSRHILCFRQVSLGGLLSSCLFQFHIYICLKNFARTYLISRAERGTLKRKCLFQEHITLTPVRAQAIRAPTETVLLIGKLSILQGQV